MSRGGPVQILKFGFPSFNKTIFQMRSPQLLLSPFVSFWCFDLPTELSRQAPYENVKSIPRKIRVSLFNKGGRTKAEHTLISHFSYLSCPTFTNYSNNRANRSNVTPSISAPINERVFAPEHVTHAQRRRDVNMSNSIFTLHLLFQYRYKPPAKC